MKTHVQYSVQMNIHVHDSITLPHMRYGGLPTSLLNIGDKGDIALITASTSSGPRCSELSCSFFLSLILLILEERGLSEI